jgi:adenine-specific DNA-methyltransferase
MVEKSLPLVIGDAKGADLAVQAYLSSWGYGLVEVFTADETPRHNVGGWPLRRIQPSHRRRDFDYYASKDREMAREATVGFLIWDGESRRTLMNILRLVALEKTAVVYVEPEKAFSEVRTRDDFERLARGLNQEATRRLHEQAVREGLFQAHPVQAPLRL